MKTICCYLLAIALSSCLISCGKLDLTNKDSLASSSTKVSSQLSETAPPKLIQELKQNLTVYDPQVKILTPKLGSTLETTFADVQLSVTDLPLFQDKTLGLGFNLHLILDDEPYIPVYSVEEPITLENLTPGTHTLRVIACLPWHESFKNQGAYAETTFNVLTETEDNYIDPNKPLLTYSSPEGNYSAEPILLDFYLKDTSEKNLNPEDIAPNSVEVTINDETFTLDQWQPIYLKGLKKGNNVVELSLLDSAGNEIENTFNHPVRLITYKPDPSDSLGKIVTNQISFKKALSIINPNYYDELVEEPTVELETETEQQLPGVNEDLSVDKKDIEATKPNEPIVQESELENAEPEAQSFTVDKAQKVDLEVEDLPVTEGDNSNDVNLNTVTEKAPKTELLDEPVVKDLELEQVENNEESVATETAIPKDSE